MKVLRYSIFMILFFCFAAIVNGQQLKEDEIVVIQGNKFVLHQVRTGETIYSITRDYKLDKSQLQENNPQISEGLDIGEILKIPYRDDVKLQNVPAFKKGDPSGFLSHTIESRNETPYFIAKKYGITVEEIYAYNPGIRRIKKGMDLRIPVWDESMLSQIESQSENRQTVINESATEEKPLQEYSVVSGETLYSISRKFGISESEIIFLNPEAKNLKAGSKIYLPKKDSENEIRKEVAKPAIDSDYIQHTIASGETMWGISQKYNTSTEELIALNPVLKTAFPAGIVINVPVKEKLETAAPVVEISEENTEMPDDFQKPAELEKNYKYSDIAVEIPEACIPHANNMFSNKTYNIALFLPLFLEANDTLNRVPEILVSDSLSFLNTGIAADTIIEQEKPRKLLKQFYGNSENFLQFYEGVLIAVDSMKDAGMKVKLNVFDTQNSVSAVRKHLNTEHFLETDLIIGPVYQNVQEELAGVAAKNRIPMVLPFTTRKELVSGNSQLFQINPGREYIAEETAEMVAEEYHNSNFIVIKMSEFAGTPEGELVNLIREKLYVYSNSENGARFSVYDYKNKGASGLRNILMPGKENVVIIPSTQEGELSIAISNINNLANDFSITLIASNNLQQRYPSIDVAHFHNLKMKYIFPFWMNYNNPATIQFVEKFKRNFATEPNSFGVQGFDAAFYFLNALNYYGNDFKECLPFFHMNLVQGNYHFEKVSQFGGYMNRGVSVISFDRDYSVIRTRVKGQPKLVAEK